MNREIKFRGKKINGSGWLYYDLINDCSRDCVPSKFQQYILDKNTIGQFTGLQDKNGFDIYEGDIVKTEKDELEIITWSNKCYSDKWGWESLYKNGDNDNYHYGGFNSENRIVIGNIYENPELLE